MRLLSSSLLLLLLAASPALSAPTLPNEETDSLIPINEGSGVTDTGVTDKKRIEELENNLDYAMKIIETMRIEKAENKLEAAKKVLKSMPTTTADPEAEVEVADEKHARDAATEIETVQEFAMCSCKVADACRKESTEAMDDCMLACADEIESYGDKSESYIDCFKQNNASIVEAETCLFDGMKGSYCSDKKTEKVNITDEATWKELTEIDYAPKENAEIKENALWKKNEAKHTQMEQFFQCTKHCMHSKFHACTAEKKCGVKMPTPAQFAEKMNTCSKKNWKISNAMLLTCQCLAWKNQVKELQGGVCAVIGNSYYHDRA